MRRFGLFAVGALGLMLVASLAADEKTKPSTKTKAPATKEPALDPAEWKSLLARRDKMQKDSEKLKEEFDAADDNGKQKLLQRAQQLQAEFYQEVQPKILKLAAVVYEKNPTDADAAQIVAAKAYSEHKFAEAMKIVQKVLDAGKKTLPLYALKATIQYATNDFEGAIKTLEEARPINPKEFEANLAPALASYVEYAGYWKTEQAIRAKEAKEDNLPRVLFKTSRGDIVLELFENEAPNTVANFISLVEAGKYNGTEFHRIIPLFMAQGGDPNTLDNDPNNDGGGGPGYTIACECYQENSRKHFQGSISMAHAGKDTGGSQFFLTHLPTAHLNYMEGKDEANHTVFGRVIKGLDVALALKKSDKIESATVIRKRDHAYVPQKMASGRRPQPATK